MKHWPLVRSIACLLAPLLFPPRSATAQSTWTGGGVDANWSTASNWDSAPANGASLTFGTGFASGVILNNDALSSAGLITFTTGLPAPLMLAGNTLTLTGGLLNNNTTAGRNVVIENDLVVSGAQAWSTAANANSVLLINGDLSGSGNLTLGTGVQSNNGNNLPTLRFGGNNVGYTGTIATTGADIGVLLLHPAAQTSGLIDLASGNRNLWLTANTAATPYTFWTGNTTPAAGNPMAVNFRNAGTSGIYLTGGDVHWNPVTSGNDYAWDAARAGTNSEIRVNGSNDAAGAALTPFPITSHAQPRTLFFGNSQGSLVLGGNRSITNGTGGANPGRVVMNFALSDDGTARNFTSSAGLLVLTRPAGGGSATPSLAGDTIVTGGALALGNMDRIFNGWLNLNGGVVLLDGISWNDFAADRTGGYRATAGTANTWGINHQNGGFAARAGNVTILIDADPAAAYGTITAGAVFNRDFTLGATARADDRSLYANGRVIIAQNTVLTAARVIRLNGGNRESASNWTIDGPVHEISGAITGSFGVTIGGGASATGGGTLRLSNPGNLFTSLAINPAGLVGGAVVIATDDAALGTGAVTVGSGSQGQAGLLLFENTGAGQKSFGRAVTIALGADASSGDSGFGSYGGDVLYTGTVTVTGARATLPVHVQAGRFAFGAGSSLENNSTGATQAYSKGGAGELVLDANTTYAGTNPNFTWALRQGTLTTTVANKLAGGTGIFDGDNLFGADGVTWPSGTGGIAGSIPVERRWRVAGNDQSYTSAAMAFAGYTTVEVEAGRVLTVSTGSNATSPSEARGNGISTPRWDLVKAGGGTWVFTNSDVATPASSGPQNGAGFIRVDEGTLDITGDYGRGSLSLNGGTILSGAFSPFTYGTGSGAFAVGAGQTNLFEVTPAGGKLGISPTASASVSRSASFHWDQAGGGTFTVAARDDLNLLFAASSFPDVAVGSTLRVVRDGVGAGLVQINDSSVIVSGTLSGSGALRVGSTGTGLLTIDGVLAAGPGLASLDVEGALAFGATGNLQVELGGGNPGDGVGFYDQVNVTNVAGSVNLDPASTLSLSLAGGFVPAETDIFYILTRADGGLFNSTFAGAPEGAVVPIGGGYSGLITYAANWTGSPGSSSLQGGNDIAIYSVVPEPGTVLLLLAGLGLLSARRRRND